MDDYQELSEAVTKIVHDSFKKRLYVFIAIVLVGSNALPAAQMVVPLRAGAFTEAMWLKGKEEIIGKLNEYIRSEDLRHRDIDRKLIEHDIKIKECDRVMHGEHNRKQ